MLKFMPVGAVAILLFAWFCQMFINAIATYGRAYKQEPFMVVSVVSAFILALVTVGIAFTLPIEFLFLGFAISNFVGIGIFYWIYKKKESSWQASLIAMQDEEANNIKKQHKSDVEDTQIDILEPENIETNNNGIDTDVGGQL